MNEKVRKQKRFFVKNTFNLRLFENDRIRAAVLKLFTTDGIRGGEGKGERKKGRKESEPKKQRRKI